MQISADSAGQIAMVMTAEEASVLGACTLWLKHIPLRDQHIISRITLQGLGGDKLVQTMSREEAHAVIRWLEYGVHRIPAGPARQHVQDVIDGIGNKLILRH